MSPELLTAVTGLLVAMLAAIPGILAFRNTRLKLLMEQQDTAVDAWRDMLEPMRKRIQDLETHIGTLENISREQNKQIKEQQALLDNMKKQNEQLINGIRLLVSQLRANGHEPVWEPKI